MLHLSTAQVKRGRNWTTLILALVIAETLLVTTALIPSQVWTRLLPQLTSAAQDGPFPPLLAPIITTLLYLLPTILGWLCHNWQRALLGATLPAWIGLGLFAIAASLRVGAFYLIAPDHVTANVSMLELFAVLGAIGHLFRSIVKLE